MTRSYRDLAIHSLPSRREGCGGRVLSGRAKGFSRLSAANSNSETDPAGEQLTPFPLEAREGLRAPDEG